MTDPEIIKIIAKRMGVRILTQEQMRKEAVSVWKIQPDCRHFMLGFNVSGDGKTFTQPFPPWLTSLDALQPVLATFSDDEAMNLHGKIEGLFSLSRDCATESMFTKFLLTVPPRTLAEAIATVIKEPK